MRDKRKMETFESALKELIQSRFRTNVFNKAILLSGFY